MRMVMLLMSSMRVKLSTLLRSRHPMLRPLPQHTGLLPLLLLLQLQLQHQFMLQHQLQSELTDLLLLQLLPLMLALINPNIFVFMSYLCLK
jgi:hypothetical protein